MDLPVTDPARAPAVADASERLREFQARGCARRGRRRAPLSPCAWPPAPTCPQTPTPLPPPPPRPAPRSA